MLNHIHQGRQEGLLSASSHNIFNSLPLFCMFLFKDLIWQASQTPQCQNHRQQDLWACRLFLEGTSHPSLGLETLLGESTLLLGAKENDSSPGSTCEDIHQPHSSPQKSCLLILSMALQTVPPPGLGTQTGLLRRDRQQVTGASERIGQPLSYQAFSFGPTTRSQIVTQRLITSFEYLAQLGTLLASCLTFN